MGCQGIRGLTQWEWIRCRRSLWGVLFGRYPRRQLVGWLLFYLLPGVTPVPSSPASTVFRFPPSPALDPNFLAVPAHSPAAVFKFIPLRPLQIPQPGFAPSSLDGAAGLGEKLRSSLPVVVSKPFQCYYRRAKELREGHSMNWNDELFSDSLEAMKMSAGCAVKKVTVAEPLVKKVIEPPVNQGLRRGFLNPRPKVPVIFTSPQKVVEVGLVGPSSPPRGCLSPFSAEGNGFSHSRNWPVGFEHNGEIVVWEEDKDYWDGLPLDWALDGSFEEEALVIRDAMEEDFLREKMITRQKSKGKRELLNLQSSINYGDASVSFRRSKGKARML